MMNMCPNLISLFRRILYTLLGMCACIQLSLVGLLVMSLRHLCDMSWLGFWLIFLFFSFFLCGLEKTLYCLCIMMRLFTLDDCGDCHQVWCVAFFPKASILVVSFGPHQWIQLAYTRTHSCFARFPTLASSRASARSSFVSIYEQSCHDWPFIEDPEINRGHSAQSWLEFCERRLRYDQWQVTCEKFAVSHTPQHVSPAHIQKHKIRRVTPPTPRTLSQCAIETPQQF